LLTISISKGISVSNMPSYRQNIFRIFALFFFIAVPFVVVYSLGFDLNLADRQLSNTISINIETLPRGADISNSGKKILETPRELRAKDNQLIPLDISLPGFKTEKFIIWAPPKENTSARITRLALLPEKNDEIRSFDENLKVVFLSDYQLLLKDKDNYFIQQYTFTGLQGSAEQIDVFGKIDEIPNNNWVKLSETSFWNPDKNLLVAKNNNWGIYNLNIFTVKFSSLVSINENNLLGLDDQGTLWQLDLNNNSYTFLDSNVQNLSFTQTPDNIWIRKNRKLYRLNRAVEDPNNFNLSDKLYTEFPVNTTFLSSDLPAWKTMNISTLYQGLLIQVYNEIYYIPDNKPNEWEKIATSVNNFSTAGNSVFWIDNTNTLFSYNLFLKQWETIAILDITDKPENVNIVYYSPWNRVLVYTPDKVFSVWFDKEIFNKNIIKYYPVTWISDSSCFTNVIDKYQFCLKDNKLVTYKNLNLW
jgi:hypothetical protein